MKLSLTVMQVQDLRELIESRLDSGEYYGNRDRYTLRLRTILGALGNALEEYEFGSNK